MKAFLERNKVIYNLNLFFFLHFCCTGTIFNAKTVGEFFRVHFYEKMVRAVQGPKVGLKVMSKK
jgi:hypothetical protein